MTTAIAAPGVCVARISSRIAVSTATVSSMKATALVRRPNVGDGGDAAIESRMAVAARAGRGRIMHGRYQNGTPPGSAGFEEVPRPIYRGCLALLCAPRAHRHARRSVRPAPFWRVPMVHRERSPRDPRPADPGG